MMALELLATLSEVGRRGSITAAARALGLTQPALTRRIQQLEEEMGTPLLVRSRAGARLTDVGRFVESEGKALLERYGRLKEAVGARLRLETGAVRIGGGATAVTCLLPDVIGAFRQEHPDVVFHVKEAGSREVEEDVARDEVELGIVTLPVQSRNLRVMPLRRDAIVLVAARTHALARRRRLRPDALSGQPLIGFEGGSAIRRLIDRALEQRGVSMRVVMELRSIQSILRMVGLDHGLAFVSRLGVDESDARIKVLDVAGLRLRRSLAVIVRRDRPLSIAGAAFLKRLRGS